MLVDSNRQRIASARLAGLRAHAGNILSEHVEDGIDLGGIGRLLALLPNDEVNSLACLHNLHTFSRAEVYQLVAATGSDDGRGTPDLRGRMLFQSGATSQHLEDRIEAGAVIRRTRLTQEFGYEAWRQRYGESAIVLARLRENGTMEWNTTEKDLEPAVGDVLIGLTGAEVESGAKSGGE